MSDRDAAQSRSEIVRDLFDRCYDRVYAFARRSVGDFIDGGGNDLCVCIGDLNNDGEVGGVDLGLWLAVAGTDCPGNGFCPEDFNGDGELSGGDLGVLLSNWGPCQP